MHHRAAPRADRDRPDVVLRDRARAVYPGDGPGCRGYLGPAVPVVVPGAQAGLAAEAGGAEDPDVGAADDGDRRYLVVRGPRLGDAPPDAVPAQRVAVADRPDVACRRARGRDDEPVEPGRQRRRLPARPVPSHGGRRARPARIGPAECPGVILGQHDQCRIARGVGGRAVMSLGGDLPGRRVGHARGHGRCQRRDGDGDGAEDDARTAGCLHRGLHEEDEHAGSNERSAPE